MVARVEEDLCHKIQALLGPVHDLDLVSLCGDPEAAPVPVGDVLLSGRYPSVVLYWKGILPSSSITWRVARESPSASMSPEEGSPPANEMIQGCDETRNSSPRNDGGRHPIRRAKRYSIRLHLQ